MKSLQQHIETEVRASEQKLSRRSMLVASGALLAAGSALAQDGPGHRHEDHAPKHGDALSAANDCIEKGQQCTAHCLVSFREGDMTLADCASKIHEMLPICQAMTYQLASNSPYVNDLAGVCIKACSDCEEQCRKHEDKHAECKACAESCAHFIKALQQMSA